MKVDVIATPLDSAKPATGDRLLSGGPIEFRDRLQWVGTAGAASSLVGQMTTRALGSAAARRLELSRKGGGEPEDRTSRLRQKINDATQRSKEFEKLRAESIALLARHVRAEAQGTQVLATLLAPALGNTLLPLPMIQIEGELPGAVLRQRPDVARAEAQLVQAGRSSSSDRLRLADYVQAISASIEPLAGSEPTEVIGKESDDQEIVVSRARREVGRGLWQLRTQAQAAQAQRLLVSGLNDTYAAQHGQFLKGQVEEAQVLDTLIQLLEEEDRLAATAGAVAMAWIAIEYSTGGSAALAGGYFRARLDKTGN